MGVLCGREKHWVQDLPPLPRELVGSLRDGWPLKRFTHYHRQREGQDAVIFL